MHIATAASKRKPAGNEFASQELILRWINGYRAKPEPKKLPAAVHAMSELGLFRELDNAGIYVGFMAGVLQANPKLAFRRRFPWLLCNVGGGMLAALALRGAGCALVAIALARAHDEEREDGEGQDRARCDRHRGAMYRNPSTSLRGSCEAARLASTERSWTRRHLEGRDRPAPCHAHGVDAAEAAAGRVAAGARCGRSDIHRPRTAGR